MQYSLVAEATQTLMPMDNLNLLPDNDVPKDGKKGENSGHSRLSVYDQKWNMINFEAVGQVTDTRATLIGMGNDDDFMSPVNEFLV